MTEYQKNETTGKIIHRGYRYWSHQSRVFKISTFEKREKKKLRKKMGRKKNFTINWNLFFLKYKNSKTKKLRIYYVSLILDSVQFGRSGVSDSLRPHESQHARPPCPSPTPGVHSNTSVESVMPSSHLILCRPLLLLPPIPPSIDH